MLVEVAIQDRLGYFVLIRRKPLRKICLALFVVMICVLSRSAEAQIQRSAPAATGPLSGKPLPPPYIEPCRKTNDDASLASCLWTIIRTLKQNVDMSQVAYNSLQVVNLITKDVIFQYPVSCEQFLGSFIPHLKNATDAIKRATGSQNLYEPKNCADVARLFKAMTTIDPQWRQMDACIAGQTTSNAATLNVRFLLA